MAGYFIHHRPTDKEEVARSAEARAAGLQSAERFLSLYGDVFGEEPRQDVWAYPSTIVWKCQKCGGWPICNNDPPGCCSECVDCSPCNNRPPEGNCINCQTPSDCEVVTCQSPVCDTPACENPVCQTPVCENPVCESPICENPVCESVPDDPDAPEPTDEFH